VQLPKTRGPTYPLLVAMHGSSFNAQHSARCWAGRGRRVSSPAAMEADFHPLEMLRAAGVRVRLEIYPAEDHVFPEDFEVQLEEAVRFIIRAA
jgi:hypothetical protein